MIRSSTALALALVLVHSKLLAQPASITPQIIDVPGGKIRVVTLATELLHPYSIAFVPDSDVMLVTEGPRIRAIRNDTLDPQPVYTNPTGTSPENNDSLKWIAIHPRFDRNGQIFFSHPLSGERGTTLAVSRGRLDGTKLVDVQRIFVADAWETSGNMGGKILFGPDETLYVTVGDRDHLCCLGTVEDDRLRIKAQSLDNHVGKTLRLNDDGTAPADNPFVGRAKAKPEIFTYGHRNGYGLAFHPKTGELWQAEIGPLGGDEINILIAGRNYGWPLVSMGRNYTGTENLYQRDGMTNPRMFWVPSISPSSLIFYTGSKFPRWRDSALVGSLNGLNVQRIFFGQSWQAEQREALMRTLNVRFRDVQQGPDGYIYVATELRYLGTATDGTVLRIEPVEGFDEVGD